MKFHLYRVIVPVTDIDQATQFYSRVLHNDGERVSNGRHYFNLGGVVLALYDPEADGDQVANGWRHHEHQYIYISVDKLEPVFEQLKRAGANMISDNIEHMPWGETLFYCRDPFDNPIAFVDVNSVFLGDVEH